MPPAFLLVFVPNVLYDCPSYEIASDLMPEPVSITENFIKLLLFGFSVTVKVITPCEVNFIALLSKLIKIYYNL